MRILRVTAVLFAGLATGLTALSLPAAAQDDLGEIRTGIERLMGRINGLKTQLQANDPAVTGVENPGPALQQLAVMEEEMRRLTGELEDLELRTARIAEDATREINDLRFRFTELEGGDIAEWSEIPPLGGGAGTGSGSGTGPAPVVEAPVTGGAATDAPQVAISEQVAFDEARAALDGGDYAAAAQKFADFMLTYPGGPLTSQAGFLRGEALAAQGLWNDAARVYLDNFSGAPDGDRAAESLYMLGLSLGKLGQTEAACQTLAEVPRRFPALAPELAQKVQSERGGLACS